MAIGAGCIGDREASEGMDTTRHLHTGRTCLPNGCTTRVRSRKAQEGCIGDREASEGIVSTKYEMAGHVPPAVDWGMEVVANNRLLKPAGIIKLSAPTSRFLMASQR